MQAPNWKSKIVTVAKGVGMDARIGPRFLEAGLG
jgi:UDP-glucose 6-dehydrogenase